MQPSALVQLCSECQDASELVLQQLSLRDLAALTASCRCLRAAVPDAVWQSTAQREYSSTLGVPAYLQRQRSPWSAARTTEVSLLELLSYTAFNSLAQLAPFVNETVAALEVCSCGALRVPALLLSAPLLPGQVAVLQHLCS